METTGQPQLEGNDDIALIRDCLSIGRHAADGVAAGYQNSP